MILALQSLRVGKIVVVPLGDVAAEGMVDGEVAKLTERHAIVGESQHADVGAGDRIDIPCERIVGPVVDDDAPPPDEVRSSA